jgi:hypothetical protein
MASGLYAISELAEPLPLMISNWFAMMRYNTSAWGLSPAVQWVCAALVCMIPIGCSSLSQPNGTLKCGPANACPDGQYCHLVTLTCWKNGTAPALDASSAGNLDGLGASLDGSNDVPLVAPDGKTGTQISLDGAVAADGGQPIGNPTAPGNLGDGCQASTDCKSGACVDGLCCDKNCLGTCQSCKQIHTGQADGTCAPVLSGKDPYNTCPDERSTNECGKDGLCDGNGACRLVDTSHVCAVATCAGSMFTSTSACDGTGACKKATSVDCGTAQCSPSQGCKKSCSSNTDCSSGSFCDTATMTCSVQKIEGSACGGASECASGFCADGVCCKTSCTGKCMACSSTLTGQASGTCYPVLPATDPKDSCAADTANTCGYTGLCDGAGACATAGTSQVCAAASCTGAIFTPTATCDGRGGCGKTSPTDCGTFGCALAGCNKTCATDTDCTTGSYCDPTLKQCAVKKVPGVTCKASLECVSGFCVDGVCCKTACTDSCYSCSNALTGQLSGTCGPSTDPKAGCAVDPNNSCGNDGTCDATGSCHKAATSKQCGSSSCDGSNNFTAASYCNGTGSCNIAKPQSCGSVACSATAGCQTSCSSDTDCIVGYYCGTNKVCTLKGNPGATCAGDNQCAGGSCVSGVCCKTACPKAADPTTCGLTGACDSSGNCKKYDTAQQCTSAACQGGAYYPASYCNGQGVCSSPTGTPCGAFICAATTGCKTSCASNVDCASGSCDVNGQCGSCGVEGSICCAGSSCSDGSHCINQACTVARWDQATWGTDYWN